MKALTNLKFLFFDSSNFKSSGSKSQINFLDGQVLTENQNEKQGKRNVLKTKTHNYTTLSCIENYSKQFGAI